MLRAMGAIAGIKKLLFIIFVGDVISKGAVRDGIRNRILREIPATVSGGILLKFVEFTDCLTPPFRHRPTIRIIQLRRTNESA